MVNDPFPRKGSLPTSYHTPRMVYFQVRQQVVAAWSPRVFRLGLPTSSSPSDLTTPRQGVSVLVLAVLLSANSTHLSSQPSATYWCSSCSYFCTTTSKCTAPQQQSSLARVTMSGGRILMTRQRSFVPSLGCRLHGKLSSPTERMAQPGVDVGLATGSIEEVVGAMRRSEPVHLKIASRQAAALPSRYFGTVAGAPEPCASAHKPTAALCPMCPCGLQAALMLVAMVEPRLFCLAMGEHAVYVSAGSATRVAAVFALVLLVRSASNPPTQLNVLSSSCYVLWHACPSSVWERCGILECIRERTLTGHGVSIWNGFSQS